MNIRTVQTKPFADQRPGTAGLRKRVAVYVQPHYLENFVQSIFDAQPEHDGETLVVGGDGRYFCEVAIPTIIRMAAANGFGRVLIGQNGLLSTPNTSLTIRKYKAFGGMILTASHNPGGPNGDFGIKYSMSNGSLATETLTEAIYERTKTINEYRTLDTPDIDVSQVAEFRVGDLTVQVLDTVDDYAQLMGTLFDFDLIRSLLTSDDFSMRYDAMSAVTGPYAKRILIEQLGASPESLMNAEPLPDFGGKHPDPNLIHASELVDFMNGSNGADFGAAVDGDGDRSMHLGPNFYVSPSDSLAILAANAHLIPGYKNGLSGLARSMPTSAAVDKVAQKLGVPCFQTPTGWKFLGNLMDAGMITICGEESFGCGSDHVREKDAMWAVLAWLNILAVRKESVEEITRAHWKEFGRHYYARYDFEGLDKDAAEELILVLRGKLNDLPGQQVGLHVIEAAEDFCYTDPVDKSESEHQGIIITLKSGSRIIYRLSGTGTVGATLRLYAESYEPDPTRQSQEPHENLRDLYELSCEIGEVRERTGRDGPDVTV